MNSPIVVRQLDNAVVLSFNRPQVRNALDPEMSLAISDAISTIGNDMRALVFKSATPGMFMSGTDLRELSRRSGEDSLARVNARLFERIASHQSPTIAVVEGWALGGGCELALACDIRISHPAAAWGLPEVRLGVIPSGGGLQRLERLVGFGRAAEMVLTGLRIDGARAHEIGLVQRVSEDSEVMLLQLLLELEQGAALAQSLAKEAMSVMGDRGRLVDAAAQAMCLASEDTQRRIATFLGDRL